MIDGHTLHELNRKDDIDVSTIHFSQPIGFVFA
jgi:hypothetical protein